MLLSAQPCSLRIPQGSVGEWPFRDIAFNEESNDRLDLQCVGACHLEPETSVTNDGRAADERVILRTASQNPVQNVRNVRFPRSAVSQLFSAPRRRHTTPTHHAPLGSRFLCRYRRFCPLHNFDGRADQDRSTNSMVRASCAGGTAERVVRPSRAHHWNY